MTHSIHPITEQDIWPCCTEHKSGVLCVRSGTWRAWCLCRDRWRHGRYCKCVMCDDLTVMSSVWHLADTGCVCVFRLLLRFDPSVRTSSWRLWITPGRSWPQGLKVIGWDCTGEPLRCLLDDRHWKWSRNLEIFYHRLFTEDNKD